MKTIDDLMMIFCDAFINIANKTGVTMTLLSYAMMLRGEM